MTPGACARLDRPARPARRHRARALAGRFAAGIATAASLAAVFWAYLQPAMVIRLADQLWACF